MRSALASRRRDRGPRAGRGGSGVDSTLILGGAVPLTQPPVFALRACCVEDCVAAGADRLPETAVCKDTSARLQLRTSRLPALGGEAALFLQGRGARGPGSGMPGTGWTFLWGAARLQHGGYGDD